MGQWIIKREGPVAVLSMDDGKANALTMSEFEGLSRALAEIAASDAGAMVLTGRPGYFTAGLNLKVLPTLATAELEKLITKFGEVTLELLLFPKPVVAAVSGHALGAGGIFAFASDVRLFAEGPFKFGLNEVPGGLFVPTFGIVSAKVTAASEQLTGLIMHGQVFGPAEALSRKIAESLHAPDALLPAAIARATGLADLGGHGYALTKKLLRGPLAEEARRALPSEVAELGTALGAKR
ncbi:MAG: Enoyl-CoA hydratase/isomerase [Myxococcaceae bacterium]|nr:Enoyl-CoA hydratase/isomerase [Myxococcaceae bacterium]